MSPKEVLDLATLKPRHWSQLKVRRTGEPLRILVGSRKGGTGKTSAVLALAAMWARWGLKIRVIDGDPQDASSTVLIGRDVAPNLPNLFDVFLREKNLDEATYPSAIDGVSLVPSFRDLTSLPDELRRQTRNQITTAGLMRAMFADSADAAATGDGGEGSGFDVELMDAGGDMNAVVESMMCAAQHLVLCLNTSVMDQLGVGEMDEVIGRVQKELNPSLDLAAVLMSRYAARTRLAIDLGNQLREDHPKAITLGIPASVSVAEWPGMGGETLFSYAPQSSATLAFCQLAALLVDRVENLEWVMGPEEVVRSE
jgi:chromosome partitioning protein